MSDVNLNEIIQIGIIVKDIQKSTEQWARFLNVPVPEIFTTAEYSETHAEYMGKPCYGRIFQSFFKLSNTEIELIQPIGSEPSVWQDDLLANGEGVHHIAFRTTNMQHSIQEYTDQGYPLVQKGDFKGGQYAYVDASFGPLLELLAFENR